MTRDRIQIRFSDIDSFEHVNNINVQHYYDYGKMIYYRDIMELSVATSTVSVVIVNVQSNYYIPILINDSIEVVTQVTEIGEKSIKFFQQIVETDTAKVKSDCTTIMVAINKLSGCSTALLPKWVEAICLEEKKSLEELQKNK